MLTILAESALRSLVLGSVVWVGLNLLRARNPHVHMTSWVMVLVASLSMPFLMHWTTVTVTLDPLPLSAAEKLWPASAPLPEPLPASSALELGTPITARGEIYQAVNWWAVATAIYALVAGMFLLRLAVGLYLTWRLARAARPISESWVSESWVRESWAGGSNLRVSDAIGAPVTFGSTVLLPPQYIDWDSFKRRAVLAHEGAHIANRDFYILLLASINRAVFWFNPLAWWQLFRMAELAEIISDARALEVLEDRPSYAEILLDFVQNVRQAPAGLEMARPCTVRARVEHILAAPAALPKIGWRERIGTLAAILPVVVVSAGSIAYRATPITVSTIDRAGEVTAAARKPQHVDFYSLGPTSVFAIFREGDDVFAQLTGQRKLPLTAKDDGTYSYSAAAGEITFAVGDDGPRAELMLRRNGRDLRAARIAETPRQQAGEGSEAHASLSDSYVGWYELAPSRVLSVTRDGSRTYVQETGRPKFEVAAQGVDAFASGRDDLLIFLRDAKRDVTQVLLQEPISGARLARRIDAAKARLVEEEFSRRMAQVPDRFREQTPMPGSRDAVLHGIEDMQRGVPNYDRMSASLTAKIRRQVAELHPMFKALGAVESIFFRGVSPGGYDIYGVKFANGSGEFRLLLGADGNADDAIFRPDGDDTPGAVLACSNEQGLRSRGITTPIRMMFYNSSGRDLLLFKLDGEGKRVAHATIGDNMSSSVLTYIDSPWLVADPSGRCLEIVLPGQHTRYLMVEAPGADSQPGRPRLTPAAGSEEMLRQYIEALRRGEPNYRMTSEVAAQTRQQLPLDQAILTRLGALRAITFRAVTALGSDVYIAHFANGSAEWRIGLVKDGMIGKIALGPQS
jgi:beta-lactamase regulating signal transducer with metallopeptidase domain